MALLAVSDDNPDIPKAAPPLMIVTSPWGPELMLMVAGLVGKMLATPAPPLVIEIGPGGANADRCR